MQPLRIILEVAAGICVILSRDRSRMDSSETAAGRSSRLELEGLFFTFSKAARREEEEEEASWGEEFATKDTETVCLEDFGTFTRWSSN